MSREFRLIETMRVSDGEVYLLERHLARLSASAQHFSFCCDLPRIREKLIDAALPIGRRSSILRLTLAQDGETALESKPMPEGYARRLQLSRVSVDSHDIFLYHKTTNRRIYEEAHRGCDDETDVILFNERGEITETTIMNIAVLRNGRWVTPRLACGLLPGVMRAELLERGEIVEGVIPSAELQFGETIRCFNAARGSVGAVYDDRAPFVSD